MRHVISILLQNEAGALARVASLFSTRGYNIESLSVAPTEDSHVSRLTLVSIGSDQVINQINQQLFKLVDVVRIADMTLGDHIERELLLLKLRIQKKASEKVLEIISQQGARILDDELENYTLELTGTCSHLDDFIERVAVDAEVLSVVRSGPLALGRGRSLLGETF
jgi:acetolactate synthase-1/3 small subunit